MMQNSKDTKWLIGSISLFPASPSSHRQPLPVSRDSLQRHSAQNVSMAVLKHSHRYSLTFLPLRGSLCPLSLSLGEPLTTLTMTMWRRYVTS